MIVSEGPVGVQLNTISLRMHDSCGIQERNKMLKHTKWNTVNIELRAKKTLVFEMLMLILKNLNYDILQHLYSIADAWYWNNFVFKISDLHIQEFFKNFVDFYKDSII